MKLSKYSRAIPNRKTDHEPVNNTVTISHMDPAEMIKLYGAPTSPLKRR